MALSIIASNMAPPNRFEPSYHPYHSDDDDFHEKEYENDPSYDEEEHDSRPHGRHQNDDRRYSSTQNSNHTCVSSDKEDDLYPPYPQVENTNMTVVSAAPRRQKRSLNSLRISPTQETSTKTRMRVLQKPSTNVKSFSKDLIVRRNLRSTIITKMSQMQRVSASL
jgi:hypothetical protein